VKDLEEIASLLKETREDAGLELEEVSNDLNIDELALKNIENGKIGAFKDIFELKNHISEYAKYLGLDYEKITANFNEYLFEYTSKIPVAEIEKTIQKKAKDEGEKVVSPYTISKRKNKSWIYILIYLLILVLVILAIFWSINQITVDRNNAYVVSYRK
jgi:cytoskeletal protein RodZ